MLKVAPTADREHMRQQAASQSSIAAQTMRAGSKSALNSNL